MRAWEPSDADLEYIREHWGKMLFRDIGKRFGVSDKTIIKAGRTRLGLPPLIANRKTSTNVWSPDDMALLKQCATDGMTVMEIRDRHFPHRTHEAVKRKRAEAMNAGAPSRFDWRKKVAANALKPIARVEWPRSSWVPATFAEAKDWMVRTRCGWLPPADRREAWREINGFRMYGPISVPPFVPVDRSESA